MDETNRSAERLVEPKNDLQNKNQVNYLLRDVNERDLNGNTPLHLALLDSPVNETIVKQLLDKSAPVNAKNNKDQTPLHCVFSGNIDISIVKLLVTRGADLKILDKSGDSPLMYAVTVSDCPIEVIKFLVERGADMYEKDRNGDSVLKNALKYSGKSLEIAKLFLEKATDVNARAENGDTLLHIAADCNSVEVTKFLLRIPGIKVDVGNKDRETPLFHALRHFDTDPELVKLLLKCGASVRKKNKFEQYPLHLAAFHCNVHIIKMLLDCGARVNVIDKKGLTPLRIAVYYCEIFDRRALKMLLDAGALIFEDHPIKKLYPDNSWPFDDVNSLHDAAFIYMANKSRHRVQNSTYGMNAIKLLLKYAILENPCLGYERFQVDEETRIVLRDFGSQCLQELQVVCAPPNVSLAQFILRSRLREDEESLTEEILAILSANSFPLYKEVVLGLIDRKELKEWFRQHSVTTVSQKNAEERQSLDYDTLGEVMMYLCEEDLLNLMLAVNNPKETAALPYNSVCSTSDCFLDEVMEESKRFFKRARIN